MFLESRSSSFKLKDDTQTNREHVDVFFLFWRKESRRLFYYLFSLQIFNLLVPRRSLSFGLCFLRFGRNWRPILYLEEWDSTLLGRIFHFYLITWRYIAEDAYLRGHSYEIFKSRKKKSEIKKKIRCLIVKSKMNFG